MRGTGGCYAGDKKEKLQEQHVEANRLKCTFGLPVIGISRMDEKRHFWCCNVGEMMWEKSTMEGRKADGQKLRRAKKLSVVKWRKQAQ